VKNSDNFRF